MWGASNAPNWGKAWTLSGSGTVNGANILLDANNGNLWFTSQLKPYTWYQAGITVRATADWVSMRVIQLNFFNTLGRAFTNFEYADSNYVIDSLANGDTIQLTTQPFYIDSLSGISVAGLQVILTGQSTSWSFGAEFSSAYVRAIPNPYA
jgi:hypothetical protein